MRKLQMMEIQTTPCNFLGRNMTEHSIVIKIL